MESFKDLHTSIRCMKVFFYVQLQKEWRAAAGEGHRLFFFVSDFYLSIQAV